MFQYKSINDVIDKTKKQVSINISDMNGLNGSPLQAQRRSSRASTTVSNGLLDGEPLPKSAHTASTTVLNGQFDGDRFITPLDRFQIRS